MSPLAAFERQITLATTFDPCDRCGTGPDGLPLGTADLQVRTPAGPLLLCDAHHAEHRLDLFQRRMWATRLPDPVIVLDD